MLRLPDNPYSQHPERKLTVRGRAASFVGGIAGAAVSVEIYMHSGQYDLLREYTGFTIPGSLFAVVLPIASELQERFRRDNGGNGDGDWHMPDFPDSPVPTNGHELEPPVENVPVSV